MRLQDIAAEAGVSKGLLHYYAAVAGMPSCRGLCLRGPSSAYPCSRGDCSLSRTVRTAFDICCICISPRDAQVWEDWLLWSEFSASAVFDTSLQPAMNNSFATWLSWLQELVLRGVQDGSIVSNQGPDAIALKLACSSMG